MEKIIIISPIYRSLINFRGDLIKSLKKKYKVIALSPSPLKEDISLKKLKKVLYININFKRNSYSPFGDLISFVRLFKIFNIHAPEIILSYGIKPIIFSGFSSIFYKKKFFFLITGLGYTFYGNSLKRRIIKGIVTFLYKISLRNSQGVIFQNKDNLKYFVNKKIIPKVKTHLVNGSGININNFKLAKLPKNNIIFLCISRLLGDKGLREYASAAKIVKNKFPNSTFNLLGNTDPSPDLIPLGEVKSWSNFINYKGCVDDVRPYIKNSHIFVLPSYHEGVSRSILEAMSMGRPILTTNAPGCKETVKNGVNGFKVSVGSVNKLKNKMIWFIKNQHKIREMGLKSRKIVLERFDVNKVNKKMISILNI